MNPNLKRLTEGAVLAALYGVLLFAVMMLPFISIILTFFLPIPFIIFSIRYKLSQALLFFIVTLVITLTIGSVTALPITLMFGSTGLVIGNLIKREHNGLTVFVGASLAYILNIVGVYVGFIIFFKINFLDSAIEAFKLNIKTAEKLMGGLGEQSNRQIEMLYESLEIVPYLLPTMLVVVGVLFALVTLLAVKPILKRLKYKVPKFPPFREWVFPRSLLWYYIISLILIIIGQEPGSALYVASINIYYVLELVLIVQGFSFIAYFLYNKGKSKAIFIIILIVSFLVPFIVLYLIRILGIIDLGFDLRKRMREKK